MGLSQPPTRADIQNAIERELERAYSMHGRDRWGRHEWYAITLEELDEAWDAIRADAPSAELQAEIVQIAAMCYRYLETGDRYRDAPATIEKQPCCTADRPHADGLSRLGTHWTTGESEPAR
jgi:hypothetical protein